MHQINSGPSTIECCEQQVNVQLMNTTLTERCRTIRGDCGCGCKVQVATKLMVTMYRRATARRAY